MQTRVRFHGNNDDLLWALRLLAELKGRNFVRYSEEDAMNKKRLEHARRASSSPVTTWSACMH